MELAFGSGSSFDFFTEIIFWTHELPIGDFGGRGPSPSVLKQKSQIDPTSAKLLGTLLKESEGF